MTDGRVVSIRIPPALLAEIDARRDGRTGETRHAAIRRLLVAGLDASREAPK